MNSQRFDELARGLAGARSRRDVLKALTGVIVAGAGTIMVQRGATFAQESCTTDDDCGTEEICCAGTCRAIECCIDEADPNARCPAGTSCFEGVCDPVDDNNDDDDDNSDGDDDDDTPTLPNTGSGTASAGKAGKEVPMSAVLAAGAAAAFTARKLLQRSPDAGSRD